MSVKDDRKRVLKDSLSTVEGTIYAVLDGAKIEKLPDLLFDHDFSHKPLYRDMGSEVKEIAETTPQFVRFDTWDYWENDLTPSERLSQLLDLMPDPSCAVFWMFSGDAKTLFRHLRTINNVMIPRDADTPPLPDPLDPEAEPDGNTATHQQVLFRHADANVMAQVLPALSPQKLTRFIGPASRVIYAPDLEWSEGELVAQIDNPRDTYNPTHPLKLSQSDMDEIEKRRLIGQRWATVNFLREAAPDQTGKLNQKDLYDFVLRCDKMGEEIGLIEDDAYRAWSLIAVLSRGKTLLDPNLRQQFEQVHMKPDKYVMNVLDEWGGKL